MTEERKNEIWAMLDADAKMAMSRLWFNTPSKKVETKLLEMLFGSHNLIAQAKEKPKFKIGDKVRILDNALLVSNIGKIATIVKQGECCDGYGWVLDIGKSVFLESELEPYTEPKEEQTGESIFLSQICEILGMTEDGKIINKEVKIKGDVKASTKEDAYFNYRLELAKEIAIALINNTDKDTPYGNILVYCAVKMANEIVKRLKETEE